MTYDPENRYQRREFVRWEGAVYRVRGSWRVDGVAWYLIFDRQGETFEVPESALQPAARPKAW